MYTQNRYRDIAIHPNGKIIYVITDSGGTTSGPSGSSSLTVTHPGTILIFTHETFLGNPDYEIYNSNNTLIYKSDNKINISSNKEIKEVQIYDLLGRLIYANKETDGRRHIIENLEAKNQILLLQIQTIDNQTISKKFVF